METQDAFLHRTFRDAMREFEAPDQDLEMVDERYLIPEVHALFCIYRKGFGAGLERALLIAQRNESTSG